MGLPLFVEPVESDLTAKTASKTRAGSPNRVDSRRPARSEIRDRRNSTRRAGVRIYGPAQRAIPRNARERFLPWVESPVPRDQDANGVADRRSGMFREALREMTGSDQRRRERIEERMSSLFGSSWRDAASTSTTQPENMSEGVDLGWWSVEPRLSQARRAGVIAYGAPQPDRNTEAPQPLPGHSSLADPLRPMFGGPSGTEDQSRASQASLARHAARQQAQPRMVRSLSARQMMPGRRAGSGLDGLGDRDRSLSPEVWDTLLSTLTPDPQPPSAGSSFASVTASQTAGPSTGTPTSAPDMAEESMVDAPCESGCENSDLELDEAEYEHPAYAQIRRRRELLGNSTPRIPNYNVDGLADSSFSRRMGVTESGHTTRQIRTANGPLTIYESTGRLGAPIDGPRSQRTSSPSARQGVWIGQLSVGAQGAEERGADGPSPTQGNPMAAEEDWSGMQRIVRSLARREDIPDEWWAEAGLSRTLGQGDVTAAAATGDGILRQ